MKEAFNRKMPSEEMGNTQTLTTTGQSAFARSPARPRRGGIKRRSGREEQSQSPENHPQKTRRKQPALSISLEGIIELSMLKTTPRLIKALSGGRRSAVQLCTSSSSESDTDLPEKLLVRKSEGSYSEEKAILKMLKEAKCPCIPKLINAENGYLYLEYCGGGHLGKYTEYLKTQLANDENKQYAVLFLLKTVKRIASALSTAHGLNILHYDIKPENILLDEQGNAYLTDFGESKVVNSSEDLERRGTDYYIAPKLTQTVSGDKKTAGLTNKTFHHVDIWALGLTLGGIIGYPRPEHFWLEQKTRELRRFHQYGLSEFDKELFHIRWAHYIDSSDCEQLKPGENSSPEEILSYLYYRLTAPESHHEFIAAEEVVKLCDELINNDCFNGVKTDDYEQFIRGMILPTTVQASNKLSP